MKVTFPTNKPMTSNNMNDRSEQILFVFACLQLIAIIVDQSASHAFWISRQVQATDLCWRKARDNVRGGFSNLLLLKSTMMAIFSLGRVLA